MTWISVYDYRIIRGDDSRDYFPVVITGLTGKRLIFSSTSDAAKPNWWLAFHVTVVSTLPNFSIDGTISVDALKQKIPLNRHQLIVLPDGLSIYDLLLELPWWHRELVIKVWQSSAIEDGNQVRVVSTVENNGQTVFSLPGAPAMPHLSQLFINGVKATYGSEYILNGSQMTWLAPLELEPSDEVELIY